MLELLVAFSTVWFTASHGSYRSPIYREGVQYPFNNHTLSWKERVDDLVSRLTVDEISDQMAYGGRSTHAPGIPRLGIKPYPWGSECNRGDAEAGPATSFPQSIGLAATFSPEMLFLVAEATGVEVRAKFNNYSRHEYYGEHTSASCWSPVINIMRDPRWGRNQETYGEDPFLSGVMVTAYVKGLQGNHDRYIRANAGCKHFDAYGGPENIPSSRFSFDAKVTERDLRMTFLPAFKMCVDAGTYSLMCSYNSVNGVPACANKRLLTDILRDEWGFNGYVISDEGAIEFIMSGHNYTSSIIDTVVAAVNAGTNLEDGPYQMTYFSYISKAVAQGKLSEAVIRKAVKPLFYTRMRLGLFDPPGLNPYASLDPDNVVQSPRHRSLSLLSAMQTFVLLKNNAFLPLPTGKTWNVVAVVGPFADNIDGMFGGYAPEPDPKYVITPRKGLQNIAHEVRYSPGCLNSDPACDHYNNTDIARAVNGTEIVFVFLGTGARIESEGNDRNSTDLPGQQLQLLKDAAEYSASAPLVLVLMNAGPLDIGWAKQNLRVVAILECFFPAQATGEALRRILFNDGPMANPAGRLPATWPMRLDQYPPITDYTMENRTYRYFTAEPLYPFGYGLSYSKFTYRSLDIRPTQVRYGDVINIDVYVSNDGPQYDGEEVVQVYVQWSNLSLPSPRLQLVSFGRFLIKNGFGVTAHFEVPLERLAVWSDRPPGFVTLKGAYTVYAGGQQPNQKTAAPSNLLMGTFVVV